MNNSLMDTYFNAILTIGVNLQDRQKLLIFSNYVDRKLTERLRKLATKISHTDCEIIYYEFHDEISTLDIENKVLENFAFVKLNYFKRFSSSLNFAAEKSRFDLKMKILSKHSQKGKIQSCSTVIPSLSWAEEIYPNLNQEIAFNRLCKDLIHAAYCDKNDNLDYLKGKLEKLKEKVNYLNQAKITNIKFHNTSNDFDLELGNDHIWVGGFQQVNGLNYLPNFPTYEIFTYPLKNNLNGTLSITRPFLFNNQLISHLTLTIKNGKIETLESNQDIREFQSFLHNNESRLFFGEIAIVDKCNPIQELDTYFNCVILDENAVSHIAIGNAYSATCRNFEENIRNDSINQSDIHIDIMFGTQDLDIIAFTENYKVDLKV